MKYTVQFHILVQLDANDSVEAERKLADVLPPQEDLDTLGKVLSRGWVTNMIDDSEETKT